MDVRNNTSTRIANDVAGKRNVQKKVPDLFSSSQSLQNKFSMEFRKWKEVILFCFILNVLAYGTYITNITYAVDDYGHIFTKINHIAQGRWFAGFLYNVVLQKSFMPTLSPLISISCYLLTGIGLCELWKIKKGSRLLLISLWCLHPYLLDQNNFRIATVIIALVYLMTISTLLIVKKGKVGFIFAVILFYLALSTYQVALGFAISAMMMQVLLLSYRGRFSKRSLLLCRKYLLLYCSMLLISVISYLVITRFIFFFAGVTVNSRVETGFMSSISQLYPKICWVVKMLTVRILPIREYVLPLTGKLIILLVYIAAIFSVLRRSPKWLPSLLSFTWIILIPLGAISFILPLSISYLPWRTCTGLVVFFVGMFALTQKSCSKPVRRTGFLAGIFLVIYFILIGNTIWYKQYLLNQKDIFVANRIISKIQTLEGYSPGMELAILGKYQNENNMRSRPPGRWARLTEDIRHISSARYSLNVSAFSKDWSKYSFLLKYLEVELVRCSRDNLKKAAVLSEDCKAWPDPSSVFIRDGIVVVVLSTVASN